MELLNKQYFWKTHYFCVQRLKNLQHGACGFQTGLLKKLINLKNTLPLWKMFPKYSTGSMWLSNKVAQTPGLKRNLFEKHTSSVKDIFPKSSRRCGLYRKWLNKQSIWKSNFLCGRCFQNLPQRVCGFQMNLYTNKSIWKSHSLCQHRFQNLQEISNIYWNSFPLWKMFSKSYPEVCGFQMKLPNKQIHLKITLPLWKLYPKSSKGCVAFKWSCSKS